MNKKILLLLLILVLIGFTGFHSLLIMGVLDSAWNPYQKSVQKAETFEAQNVEGESYIACGCGCCSGLQLEPEEQCIYHANGDNLQNIIDLDKVIAQNPDCANQGCSFGKKYLYCD